MSVHGSSCVCFCVFTVLTCNVLFPTLKKSQSLDTQSSSPSSSLLWSFALCCSLLIRVHECSHHHFVCMCICLHTCTNVCFVLFFRDATTHTHTPRRICHSLCTSLIGLTPHTQDQLQSLFTSIVIWLGLRGLISSQFHPAAPFIFPARANPSTTESQTGETVWGERLYFPFDVWKKSQGEQESGCRVFQISFFLAWKNISSLETRLIWRFHSGHATWVSPPFLTCPLFIFDSPTAHCTPPPL